MRATSSRAAPTPRSSRRSRSPRCAASPTHLLTSGTVTRPIDDALIARAREQRRLDLHPDVRGRRAGTNFETLEKTLSDPAKSIAIDDAVIGYTTGDPITHSVHFKGCNIGKAPAFLTKFREALGGNVMVTAPKHFHGIYEHTAYGTFEYMAYEFQVRNKTYFPSRAAILAAFDAGGFTFIDGTAGADGRLGQVGAEEEVSKSVKTPLNGKLGVTHRQAQDDRNRTRVPRRSRSSSAGRSSTPAARRPTTTAARQAAFEASVSGDAVFQSTHDYPWYERLGYADVDRVLRRLHLDAHA